LQCQAFLWSSSKVMFVSNYTPKTRELWNKLSYLLDGSAHHGQCTSGPAFHNQNLLSFFGACPHNKRMPIQVYKKYVSSYSWKIMGTILGFGIWSKKTQLGHLALVKEWKRTNIVVCPLLDNSTTTELRICRGNKY